MTETDGFIERYSGETYGRLLGAIYLSAAVVFLVGMGVDHARAGFIGFVGLFVIGLIADFALRRSSVTVYDERYDDLTKKASAAVFSLYGGGGFVVFVSLLAAEFAGVYEMGPIVELFFMAWSAFVLTWGVFYTYYKYI
ncbi:MAG: hypothetical protein ACI9QA_000171 [Methanobacteriota archaeon]|jgi:hypothetical protein|uniref:DUF2178 domain-containing protein n=1 Tax=Halorutilus salinus TaxID=2487751 RepID=A0A9Q4C2M2_9EURY|nr:hypothetical protein [Halorutilus salinus]MCX2818328.1 hypothetical protein [Halorutilus salinus]